jgi:UDPglucose 6-dehydrogenase
MTGLLKDAVIFDGRNLFDVESMEKKGFHYESIGRPLVNQPKFV